MLGILIAILLVCVSYYFFVKPFKLWQDRNVSQKSIREVLGIFWDGLRQKQPFANTITDFYNEFPTKRYVEIKLVYAFY